MFLENLVKTGKGIRRFFRIGLIALAIGLTAACPPPEFPDDIDVTLHEEDAGTLTGTTLRPFIRNNQVLWEGIDAEVKIPNTEFVTTSTSDGLYVLDDIPTGAYNVRAKGPTSNLIFPMYSGTSSAIITDGGTTTADIQMEPSYHYADNTILYGKIYSDKYKTSPFAGELVKLYKTGTGLDSGETYYYYTGKNTTTSYDGSYALYYFAGGRLRSGEGINIYFFDENGQFNNPPYTHINAYSGVINNDAYAASQ